MKHKQINEFLKLGSIIALNDIENNLRKQANAAVLGSAAALPLSALMRTTGVSIPMLGALGGGLSWIAEKELLEDNDKVELLKNQIKQYKQLAFDLEKHLRKEYGYKTKEEIDGDEDKKSKLKKFIIKKLNE